MAICFSEPDGDAVLVITESVEGREGEEGEEGSFRAYGIFMLPQPSVRDAAGNRSRFSFEAGRQVPSFCPRAKDAISLYLFITHSPSILCSFYFFVCLFILLIFIMFCYKYYCYPGSKGYQVLDLSPHYDVSW